MRVVRVWNRAPSAEEVRSLGFTHEFTFEAPASARTGKDRMREVIIKPVLNGWVCHVGCQVVVFNTAEQLLTELGAYLRDPHEVEKRFSEQSVNKRLLNDVPPHPAHVRVENRAFTTGELGDIARTHMTPGERRAETRGFADPQPERGR